ARSASLACGNLLSSDLPLNPVRMARGIVCGLSPGGTVIRKPRLTRRSCVLFAAAALAVGAFAWVAAAADSGDAPAKPIRIYGPYAKLQLTDEQKAQVVAIQTAGYEQEK